jgi:hypothetical protein
MIPVGVSPGSLAWRSSEVSNLGESPLPVAACRAQGEWDGLGRAARNVIPGMPALRIVRTTNGHIQKTIQVAH